MWDALGNIVQDAAAIAKMAQLLVTNFDEFKKVLLEGVKQAYNTVKEAGESVEAALKALALIDHSVANFMAVTLLNKDLEGNAATWSMRGAVLGAVIVTAAILIATSGSGSAAKTGAQGTARVFKEGADLVSGTAAKAARALPSSKALGRALEAAENVRPPGSAAHHIVAGKAKKAAEARAVLDKFRIGINDASNGAFLSKAVHDRIHTNKYYETVNSALRQATTREEALQALDAIRSGLQ